MKRENLLKLIAQPKVQTYGYTVIFFIIFGFFVLFGIRPNVISAFRLQKELTDLKSENEKHEKVILRLMALQSILNARRDDFPLLTEAIPSQPYVSKLLNEFQKTASESGVDFSSIAFDQAQILSSVTDATGAAITDRKLQTYGVTLDTDAPYESVVAFMRQALAQRRLKMVKNITISRVRGENASESAGIRVHLEMYSYYLP